MLSHSADGESLFPKSVFNIKSDTLVQCTAAIWPSRVIVAGADFVCVVGAVLRGIVEVSFHGAEVGDGA